MSDPASEAARAPVDGAGPQREDSLIGRYGSGVREIDAALDVLVERFGSGPYVEEVAAARRAYADRTGRVFEEDELYESRTLAFLEWYVTERPLAREGRPPVLVALADTHGDAGAEPDQARAWRAWALSHRSLFAVVTLTPGVVLDDVFGGARFAVDERRRLHGVEPGDVLEARLLGWRDRVRFGRTFGFHPHGTGPAIRALAARGRSERQPRADIVDAVARLRVRALRFRHVDPVNVYAGGTGEPPAAR